jgi:putative aldouronate transport system permease protein
MSENSFYTVLIFGLWMQFASGLIIYLSAMCSISTEVLDYGRLEPLTWWKELTHVIIPSIFPTITTYLVVEIAKFFTYYGFFYSFFGGDGRGETPFDTLGYYFFVKVVGDNVQLKDYPYAAASGLTFTLIVAPLTLLTKHLLEKYGPSED